MLRLPVIVLIFILSVAAGTSAGESFEDSFEDATLRIDYHHTGNAEEEIVAIDRLYRQGAWAGPLTRLIDGFSFGGYRVQAHNPESGALLFSRGFDSYFGEYRTTSAATAGTMRTYHESSAGDIDGPQTRRDLDPASGNSR